MKKILLISEVYKRGGAGNATSEIFKFFQEKKIEFKLLVPFTEIKDENIISYYNFITIIFYKFFKLLNRFLTLIFSKNKNYFFNNIFNFSFFSIKKIKKKIKSFKPDYVMVLWYEYIINHELILKIKNELNVKIIMYPFDMFSFTGGCRYTQSCENYLRSCVNCPATYLTAQSKKNYYQKKSFFEKIDPIMFFPSRFSLEFALKTKTIKDNDKNFIFYYPVSKKNKSTSLLENKKINSLKKKIIKNRYKNIIFFGSQNPLEWRKGMYNLNKLIQTYKATFKKNYDQSLFIGLGKNIDKIFSEQKNDDNFITFDFLNHEDYYNILDLSNIVIIPSLQEWSSLMLSEAFFANKILIGFQTGSSKDYIIENLNGFILDAYNASSFCHTMNKLFQKNFLLNDKKLGLLNSYIDKEIKKNNSKIYSYLEKNSL